MNLPLWIWIASLAWLVLALWIWLRIRRHKQRRLRRLLLAGIVVFAAYLAYTSVSQEKI